MKLTVQGSDRTQHNLIHRISFDINEDSVTSGRSVVLKDVLNRKQTWELAEWIVEKYNLDIDIDRNIFYDVQEKISLKEFYIESITEGEVVLTTQRLYIGL